MKLYFRKIFIVLLFKKESLFVGIRSDAERVLYGLANELRLPLGGDIATLSASMVRLRKSFSGSPIAVRHGNSSLLHNLSICIPYENILLSKEVVKITWQEELTNKPRAKVFTQDGDEFEGMYNIYVNICSTIESCFSIFALPCNLKFSNLNT